MLTIYRISAAPVLLLLLMGDLLVPFKWGLLVSFITDATDGIIARRSKSTTQRGARLDSLGDDLTVAVGIIGILRTDSLFLTSRLPVVAIVFALYGIQVLSALVRYGRISNFHTWLAKVSAMMQAAFICTFFLWQPSDCLFYPAAIITGLSLIEETIMVGILPTYKVNVHGWYHALKLRQAAS